MANDDLIKDVFGGSDSDTDDDAPAPAARGADSGDEEAPPADAPPADSDEAEAPKFRSSLEEPEDDEDDEDAADRRAPITGPPLHIERALHAPLPSHVTPKLVRLTNIAGVESRAFDPATFEPAEDHHEANRNVVRWRRVSQPDGTVKIESNARFVRWSDGTTQLLIGDEVLGVSEQSTEGDDAFVYARPVPGVMQAAAKVRSKLVFRPTNLDSKTHQRLTRAIDRKHVKTSKTMMHIEVQDPERAKEEADREAERLMKEQEALKKRQNAAMGRAGYGGGASARVQAGYREYFDRGAGMDGDFLEADEEDEEDDGAAEKAAAAVRAGGDEGYDDEAAFDDDEREADAAKPKRKRGRAIEESDSE